MNGRVLAVFGPVLILTGIAGFLVPPRFALMSGAPAYNVFHIVFGMIGTALVVAKSAAGIAAFNLGFGIVDVYQAVAGVTGVFPARQFRYKPADHVAPRRDRPGAGGGRLDGAAMIVDLRSDTFTKPTPAMRAAMAGAEVGDDVWGEDPTARRWRSGPPSCSGKRRRCSCPSGTMANQIALLLHCRPGDEVIVGRGAHTRLYESGAGAAWAGVQFAEVGGADGTFAADDVDAAALPDDRNLPHTRLVAVENTHNRGGGRVWPRDAARGGRGARARRAASRCTSTARGSGTPPSRAASRSASSPRRSTPCRPASPRGWARRSDR